MKAQLYIGGLELLGNGLLCGEGLGALRIMAIDGAPGWGEEDGRGVVLVEREDTKVVGNGFAIVAEVGKQIDEAAIGKVSFRLGGK